MNRATRLLAAAAGLACLATGILIPEGWGPAIFGAAGFSVGMAVAVFGNE